MERAGMSEAIAGKPSRSPLITLTLLWLCGIQLRMAILAPPPVLTAIHADLGLSATQVGMLASLPNVLFALAALPGSLMIARLGARAALIVALLITCLGAALRGLGSDTWALFAATAVMSAGVAILQPTMPVLAQRWLATRIGFATAVYTNGAIIGSLLPVWATVPFVLPLVDGNWRADLAAWSLPGLATALLVAAFAPRQRQAGEASQPTARLWWPDWKDRLVWVLGILFGAINCLYFATNFFLPDYLDSYGRADLIPAALTSLSLASVPASFLFLAAAHKVEGRAWPFIGLAAMAAVGFLGLAFAVGRWLLLWTTLIGFGTGAAFSLGFALPALLSAPQDVARTSAGMFTISYAISVVLTVFAGMIWDMTGAPVLVLAPIGFCTLLLAAAALHLHRYKRF